MRKVILCLWSVYENLFKNIVLYTGTFVTCILLLFVFYLSDNLTTTLRYFENGRFDEYVFLPVEVGRPFEEEILLGNVSDDYKEDNVSKLESLGDIAVGEFSPVITLGDFTHLNENQDPLGFDIFYPGTPSLLDMQIRLSQGRQPDKSNEVVLCEEASETYSLGETIVLSYGEINKENSQIDWYPVTVRIVGFMEKNTIFKDETYASTSTLSNLLQTHNATYDYFGFCAELSVSDDGHTLKPSIANNLLACRSISGKTAEELKQEILSHFPFLNNYMLYTGQELKESYLLENRTLMTKIIVSACITGLLLACFLVGALYLQARKKTLEMTVLYMNGLTWYSSVSMMFASFLPGIVLGIAFGVCCYYPLSVKFFEKKSYFHLEYVIISIGISLLLAILCMVPIYIELARRSPIETIRKD